MMDYRTNRIKNTYQAKIQYILFVFCFIIMIISMDNASKILNENNLFTILPFIILSAIILILRLKNNKRYINDLFKNKLLSISRHVFMSIFIGFVLTQTILYPLDLYNIKQSKNNSIYEINCDIEKIHCDIEKIHCDIEKIHSNKGRSKSIHYTFNNEPKIIRVYKGLGDLLTSKDFSSYYLVLNVQDGLFKTIIIKDWRIEHK